MLYDELHAAEILRSLEAGTKSLEGHDFSVEELCVCLEALVEVVDGEINHSQFIKKLGIKDIVYF